jgi:hypothetical protein
VYSVATIQDVDGDGVRDVVAAVWNTTRAALCVSGATGLVLWTQPNVGGYGMQVEALRDVDGDGVDEVLVGSWNNALLCLRGRTGAVLWSLPTGSANGGDVWTVAAIPDVDGDGVDDALGGSFDTYVYCASGRTGALLWSQPTGNRVFSVSWVGDADGDGKPEALAGTQDTTNKVLVYGIEGDSGLALPRLVQTGTPALGQTVALYTTGLPGDLFGVFLAAGTAALPLPPFGTLLLDPATLTALGAGAVPANGTAATPLPVPNLAALVGLTVHFQALVGANLPAGVGALTNRASMTIQ